MSVGAGGTAGPLPATLERLLHAWMPAQRWYPAKGRGVGLRGLGASPVEGTEDGVELRVHVVGLDSGDRLDVVQVPLTYRSAPLPGGEHALVGVTEDDGTGTRWVYDAPHDPAYVSALLRSLTVPDGGTVVVDGPSRVLRGEQSNTSIIVEPAGAEPMIVKVFRTLHAGANPDVEVLAALTRVGCAYVPSLRGWLEGSWSASAEPDAPAVAGHLAVAVEFLPGSEDAWRVALAAVREGTSFAAEARDLGAATARVHQDLAVAFGTTPVDEPARTAMVDSLRARLAWARAAVPDLDASLGARLDAHDAALGTLTDLPALQRVHGDLHLGQVLHAPRHGWVLLDFEGEPLRPLHERTLPDLALRDVAGMLRSLDYAAGHAEVGSGGSHDVAAAEGSEGSDGSAHARAQAWAAEARDAFCAGYGSVTGHDPRDQAALLAALELDKALYEVVYEARNRPTWLPIPLAAVTRLLP
jgi:predicted trehalose synthase